VRLLGWVEQEVDLPNRVDHAGRPDSRGAPYERRRSLAGELADELARAVRVLDVEVRAADIVGDRQDLPSAITLRTRDPQSRA